jgi:hypothetical protein
MARFTKAIDIWAADASKLQPGQWVYAGHDDGPGSPTRGRFFGVKRSGSIVVAWLGNARSDRSVAGYFTAHRKYAKA